MQTNLTPVKKLLNSKYTAIAILLIISISVYFNALSNDFIYDDKTQVLENQWIRDAKHIPEIFLTDVWAFSGEERLSNYYRPLMHIIYMIDYHIFGLKPWGFHLTNIIFHAGVTLLVFLIASILINQPQISNHKSQIINLKSQIQNPKSQILSPAFIAALLFAIHPIHTEAVTWIAGIPELSFTLFYLLSFYLYINPVRDKSLNRRGSCKSIEEVAFAVPRRSTTRRAGIQKSLVLKNTGFPIKTSEMTNRDFYKSLRIKVNGKWGNKIILSAIFFFLATLCKEPALTLPLLMLVYDYSISRSSVYGSRFTVHCIIKRYLPYLIVSIIYFILRTYAIGGFAPKKVHVQLSNYEYFINIFPLFIKYLEKLLLPINLNFFYVFHPISSIFELKGIITLILTLGFIFLVYFFRRHKVVFLSLLWIVIPLLPVLYIPALGESTFTERYLYLPSVGFVVLVALAIYPALCNSAGVYQLKVLRRQTANFIVISVLIILTGLYSIGTIKRNYIWRDSYTFWTDTVEKSPDGYIPHGSLGNVYFEQQRFDEAIKEYMIAIKLKPDSPEAHNSLGLVYFDQQRFEDAIKEYMIAIKLKPDSSEAHNNLGLVYFEQQKFEEAIKEYMTVIKLKPNSPAAYYNIGNLYSTLGKFDEAIKEYMIALRLKPNYAEAHYNLGVTYLKKGLSQKAEEEFKTALQLRPDFILLQPKRPLNQ